MEQGGQSYEAGLGVPQGRFIPCGSGKTGGIRTGRRSPGGGQNDVGNFYAPTITIAPLTSRIEKKKSQPTHYLLRKAKGLQRPSMVLAEQLTTRSKTRVIRYLGKVSKGQMRGIDEAVRVHLGYYIDENAGRLSRPLPTRNGGNEDGSK